MNFEYAAAQLAAVWKMAWNRPGWADTLDRSVDGVFRSFWAMAIAAPFALLGYLSLRRAASRMPELSSNLILEAPLAITSVFQMIGFVIDWGVSLTALILAARALGVGRRITDVIVGFNWMQVLIAIFQAIPLAALSVAGGQQIASLLFLPAIALVIALYWGLIRRSLETNIAATIGLIVLLTLLGVITNSILSAIAGTILHTAP